MKKPLRQKNEPQTLINEKIRVPKVQLIDHTGQNVGVIDSRQALRMAQDAGLDLVMIADEGKDGLPVTKIMDFGKMLYEKKKKQAEAKKHQKVIQVKEVKMSPKIGAHDYQTKIKRAEQFLREGKRVKMTLFFRGRENVTKVERGTAMFDRIHKSIEAIEFDGTPTYEQESKMGQFWSRVYLIK